MINTTKIMKTWFSKPLKTQSNPYIHLIHFGFWSTHISLRLIWLHRTAIRRSGRHCGTIHMALGQRRGRWRSVGKRNREKKKQKLLGCFVFWEGAWGVVWFSGALGLFEKLVGCLWIACLGVLGWLLFCPGLFGGGLGVGGVYFFFCGITPSLTHLQANP